MKAERIEDRGWLKGNFVASFVVNFVGDGFPARGSLPASGGEGIRLRRTGVTCRASEADYEVHDSSVRQSLRQSSRQRLSVQVPAKPPAEPRIDQRLGETPRPTS